MQFSWDVIYTKWNLLFIVIMIENMQILGMQQNSLIDNDNDNEANKAKQPKSTANRHTM